MSYTRKKNTSVRKHRSVSGYTRSDGTKVSGYKRRKTGSYRTVKR